MLINKRKSKGASMVEYILGVSILVIALFVIPIAKEDCLPDMGRQCGRGISAIELLERSLKAEYSVYSKSIASPR